MNAKALTKRFATTALALALAVAFMPAVAWTGAVPQAQAADSATASHEIVTVTGTEDYDEAHAVLDIVNKERTALGLDPLQLDVELTETAMQRAAELSVLYSHNRPDGTDCFTAFPPSGFTARGENIAIGYDDAADVMEGWFYSERKLYEEGERDRDKVGHYLNIINPDFKSIGIGCFVQGTYYWEQALSGEEPARITTGGTVEKSHRISIDYDVCGTDQGFNKNDDLTGKTLAVGETFEMHYDVTNDRWRYNYVTLDPSCVTWTSSDTSVCTVDPAGVVTARAVGKATVTATLPSGRSLSHEWTVVEAKPESTQVMYRLYNPNSGEHFYTASTAERDATIAAGWNDEGIGWTAPSESDTPVYRLYSGTDHHYTTSIVERDHLIDVGWTLEGDNAEGIAWYSDDQKRVPLYRQFNPNVDPTAPFNNSGSHNYTTSLEEHEQLISIGWRGEDIGWYGVN